MYTALYRAYRPETFETVLGQEHIVKILKNQIAQNATGHAYLFCGTRGTGKTTTARLLAKGVNCTSGSGDKPCGECENCKAIKDGNFIDVIEIDAASNNGVDNIRELNESVKYPPVIGRKKVYIIDEVHMLSTGAFNALLKTLEEPPENVMFILATTEPQKLPATILSRCLKLDFRRVPENVLKTGMKDICTSMGIDIDDGALSLVAANADGSVRDGLSILDQCLSAGSKNITRDDVLDILGTVGEDTFIDMTDAVIRKNVSEALILLDRVLSDGKDVRQFMRDWVAHYRNLLITKFVNKAEDMLNMSCENIERIAHQAQRMDVSEINNGILELSKTMADAKWSTQPRVLLELCIVKMSVGISGVMAAPIQQQAVSLQTGFQQTVQTMPPGQGAQISQTAVTGFGVQQPSAGNPEFGIQQPADGSGSGTAGEEIRQQEESGQNIDKDELWNSIFETGEANSATFNLIRTGAELVDITDKRFLIIASNSIVEGYVQNKRHEIESIMAGITGKRRELVCHVRGEAPKNDHSKADAMRRDAEKLLGISVEMI